MVFGTNFHGQVMVRYLFIFLLFISSAFAADGDPVLVPGTTELTTLGTIITPLDTESKREKNEVRIVFTDSPYAVGDDDHIIFCDTDGGAIEIDYPAGTRGRELIIKGAGSSGNDCTLDPNGTEQIFAGGAGVAFTMHDGEVFDTHYDSTKGWR